MYVVGARVTFPNELTKQSIKSYMTSELEGMNKMIMSFKIDTSYPAFGNKCFSVKKACGCV